MESWRFRRAMYRLMLFTTLFPAKDYIWIPVESEDDDEEDDDEEDDDDSLANRRKRFTESQVEEIHSCQRTFLDDFPSPDLRELYTVATFVGKLIGWVFRHWRDWDIY